MRQPYAYLNVKPPYCDICTHYHWKNLPHIGNDWPARVASRVQGGDMTIEQARAQGMEVTPDGTVSPIEAAPPHDGDGLTVQTEDPALERLIAFLKLHPNALQDEIKKGVRARWQAVRHKLTELVGRGVVKREGAGTRASPHRYNVGN